MFTDRLAFVLWNASLHDSDLIVLRRCGRFIELQLRGGSAGMRSVVLRKRD